MHALIVGSGKVGSAVVDILSSKNSTSSFFTSSDNWSDFEIRACDHDIVFLTISTHDTGEIALAYIKQTLSIGKPIVICEKGSLSYHFTKLQQQLDRIGYTATVGGGSGMLNLFSYPHFHVEQIVGIVNGTNNFLFSECALGRDPYKVLTIAKRMGLCEPGGNNLAEIVNGEIRDTVQKACIIFNCSGISTKTLMAKEFGQVCVFEEEVLRLLKQKTLRFIVSIGRKPNIAMKNRLFDSLHVRKESWHIEIGVAKMSLLPFHTFPVRQENALVIHDSSGLAQISGVGAGPIPTAAAMVMDAERLLCTEV